MSEITFQLRRLLAVFGLAFLLLLSAFASAWAWPTDSQWFPLSQGYAPIHDPLGDAGGERNVVPDSGAMAAAYVYNDGVNSYYRIRLDASPEGGGGQGYLRPFSWGFEIDTDQNADDYEWLIIINGLVGPEVIELRQNTVRSQLGDPSDKAEYVAAQYPVAGNYRILPAGTCFNGPPPSGTCNASNDDLDYFLDFKLPVSVLKAATGITDDTLIRYFVGSTSADNNLSENGADLVGGSTLYEGLSDYITLSGSLPPGATFDNGSVRFTEDLGGFGDRAVAGLNETLYIRVDDLDLDFATNPSGEVRVLLTSPTGDSEILHLSATGVQGKYTGSIPTSATANGVGTLYVTNGQTVTVTFIEAIAANRVQNVTRTDSVLFSSTATDLSVVKSLTSNPTVSVGSTVTYSIKVTNHGPNTRVNTVATDLLPAGLNFVSATFAPAQGSYNSGSGAWTLGTLASGSSVTMTLTATVAATATGSLTNTVSLPADGNLANNTSSVSVFVGGTDLQITKTVSDPVPVSGNTVAFTVRVINLGPNSTDNVRILDLLPAGLTYSGATASQGSYVSGTGLWTVGTIASGGGAQLTINATVSGANGQVITNTASLNSTSQPDINPANNNASATLQVGYTDLVLTKTARKLTPPLGTAGTAIAANIGNTVEFTVTLSNNGPHTATNITVKDLLPVGMTFLSSAVTAGNYVSGSGLWTLASLATGSSATLSVQAGVNAGTAGQVLLNEARITAVTQPDHLPGNEYATASVAVNGTDLQVIKSVSNRTPSPGQNVTWTVTVRNNGPNTAGSIVITDILPTGLTYVSNSASVGSYSAGKNNSSWQWSGFSLNVLAQATLQITTRVDSGTAGRTITNDAFLTSASVTDADESNNTGSASIAVSGTDLRIAKTASPDYPSTGDTVTYVLTAHNDGPNSASGIVVNDLLPPELAYASHSGGSYAPATGLWSVGTLANGASSQLTILATVLNDDDSLLITNTATISAPAVGDPNMTNNIATADIHVGATDIAISKNVSNAAPSPGTTIDYLVTASNVSNNPATGIQVQDILPAGVTYSSHTASQGAYAFGLWLVGNLDKLGGAKDSATLTIRVTVDAPTAAIPIGSTISNTAELTDVKQVDTNSGNNSAGVDITLTIAPPSPSLMVVKSANTASASPGQTITYTLTFVNSGAGDATDVVLNDAMSPYTAFGLDTYGPGIAFQFTDGSPASGLSLGTPVYSDDGGTTFGYAPASGFDGNITNWQMPMTGIMNSSGGFTLRYQVQIK